MMKLKRLLLLAILAPSIFIVLVGVLSFLPHQRGLVTHEQEHLAVVVVIVVGIIPFSFLMLRIFHHIQSHILHQNEELARRTMETEALLKVGRAVEQSMDLDRILPAALEAILEATTGEAAEVWLVDQEQGVVRQQYHEGEAKEAFAEINRFPIGEGYPGIVAQTGKPIFAHNLLEDVRFLREGVKKEGFRTFCAVPLRRKEVTVGVLTAAARGTKALTSESEHRLLILMAERIAMAIENARLHNEVQSVATMEERERIAREMHDGLAQVLTYVNAKSQAVRKFISSGQETKAKQQLMELEDIAKDMYADVREAILDLRTSTSRHRDITSTLEEYVLRFSEMSGIKADLTISDGSTLNLSPNAEVQVIRIIQEALTNVRKHARASQAHVRISTEDSKCNIIIEDDGLGFDVSNIKRDSWPQFGLQTMKERAESAQGTLDISSSPGSGTRVILNLPMTQRTA